MRTVVVAVAILGACFMQEVSGVLVVSSAPVNSATLKPEAKIELKEEMQVLDEDNEKMDDTDNEEDEEQDDTEDEEQDEDLDEDDEEIDDTDNEEDEEQDDVDEATEDETRAAEVQKRVAGMSQSVQKLYMRAEELVTHADKHATSTEANRAADQAEKDFLAAFDKELGSEAKLGEQGNEKVEKNEEEAVRAKASQSEDADKLYARVYELVKESKQDGASDEAKKAAHEAVKQLGLGKD